MTRYLTAVFKVMVHAESLECSPKEYAERTALQAFEEADLDHDGNLSLDEFQWWYSQESGIKLMVEGVAEEAAKRVSLVEARRLTNLAPFSVHDVLELFASKTGEEGTITCQDFAECFEGPDGGFGVALS